MKFEKKIFKYRQVLLWLNIKQVLQTLPKLLLINLAILAIMGLAAFAAIHISKAETSTTPVTVALVTEDDSWWIQTIQGYIEKNINCSFIPMTEEAAMTALDNQEITAILILPEDVIDAITRSQDGAARLIFAYPGQFTSLKTFQNLTKTGMADIAALDAAEKLIAYIQRKVNKRVNYSQVYQIEDKLIFKVLVRQSSFNKILYSDTGDIDFISFYIGNGILAILLFTGIFLQELLSRKSRDYLVSLDRQGISPFEVSLYQFLAVALIYITVFYILYFIATATGFVYYTPLALLAIPVFILDVTGILFVCYQLCDSKFTASIIIFLGSLVMMFFSGNIIPASFLPKAAHYLGYILPTKYFAQIIGEIIAGMTSIKSVLIGSGWLAMFILFDFICCKIRRNK